MKPVIIAHRGNNQVFPENSLAGLRSAYELGCNAVEFDLQMTTDKQLVILHDSDTKRTSDTAASVFTHSYAQLHKISVHEPARFATQHYPTPISLLQDFLPLLSHYPQAHAYIELKQESLQHWGRQCMVEALLPLLTPFTQQCTIISFDLNVLTLIRQHSHLSIGWVLDQYSTDRYQQASRLFPEFLIIDHALLSTQQRPWVGSWEWMVYGVDSVGLAMQHANNGVKLIETDQLPVFAELL